MISKWGVKNFKSIKEANLDLAPLTVFTGVNSSGKSSFLQSIVMLAQAARSEDSHFIPLKGDLIDLGSFDRVYNNKADEEPKHIDINFTIPIENDYVNIELGLGSAGGNQLHGYKGHIEYNKKEGDKITSLKWKSKTEFPFDCSELSELYDKIWRKSISQGEEGIQTDIIEIDSSYLDYAFYESSEEDVATLIEEKDFARLIYNYCRRSKYWDNNLFSKMMNIAAPFFIPFRLRYGLSESDKSINIFIKLLADIPHEELTEEKAKQYVDEQLKKMVSDSYYDERLIKMVSGVFYYDDFKRLFYLCANNPWWMHSKKDKKLDNSTVLFKEIPDFEKIFVDFRHVYDSGSEYYTIELSDWYRVLSMQDKDKQEAIKKELTNETGFVKSLRDNIANFNKQIDYLFLPELLPTRIYLMDYFKHKIQFLRPLREEPDWTYRGDPEYEAYYEILYPSVIYKDLGESRIIIDIGVKGEMMPFIIYKLHTEFFEIENYYSPEFIKDKDKSFSEALKEWLKYFELADGFKPEKDNICADEYGEPGEIYLIIKNEKDNEKYALPQLGTGVSQVLPILVRCLAAPVGSTLIIQEPEQSLHPKIQSRLADFFIAMSLSGRQCLIETHSEYIIEKLRYRIVKGENENIKTNTKIYFTEKKGGKTEFEEIKINEYGAIMNWPDDFFDESSKWADEINKAVSEKWEKNNKEQ